jgi:hypothetical protein
VNATLLTTLPFPVIPAQAGIHFDFNWRVKVIVTKNHMDSRFRENAKVNDAAGIREGTLAYGVEGLRRFITSHQFQLFKISCNLK